jgi:hypothetical protein
MAVFAFRLDFLAIKFQRGKLPDVDLITFAVLINQIERGHVSTVSGALISGFDFQFRLDPGVPTTAPLMYLGPFDIKPGDLVTVAFSGMNISDNQSSLDHDKVDTLELKILGILTSAAIGALGGEIGSAIASALGAIGDPLSKLLGVSPQGPCNGLVFSDGIPFTEPGLVSLPFSPTSSSRPDVEANFTRSYTDAATHDTSICGHIAETDVHFSVIAFPAPLSVRALANIFFSDKRLDLGGSLRQLGSGVSPLTLRSLFLH